MIHKNIENAFRTTSNTNFQWGLVTHTSLQPATEVTLASTHFQAPPMLFTQTSPPLSHIFTQKGVVNKEKLKHTSYTAFTSSQTR